MKPKATPAIALAALLTFSGSLRAGEIASSKIPDDPASAAAAKKEEKSFFDELWGYATLYKNDGNPFIEEFKLRGRYHGQYAWLESDQGDTSLWEDRRSRFGFDAKLFNKKIELRLDAQSVDGFDPFYDRLVDAYIKWKPSENFSLTVGRQKPQIAYYDWLQSTNNQPTFERSQIFNQLRVDRATGAVVEGKSGHFTWQAGVYANDTDREFGPLNGGYSYGAGIGYDFKHAWDLERADWRLDWLHSNHHTNDTILNRYDDILTTTLWVKTGYWNLVTEAFYASGDAAQDAFGFYIQPTYDIIPKRLQLVGRYTFSTGDGPDSIFAQTRYERSAPRLTGGGRGEQYQAGYLGLQYFIYGDKLKLMAGAEYAHLDGGGNGGNFDGLTVLTGIRFSF